MLAAFIQDNIVKKIDTIESNEDYIEISKSWQAVVDISSQNPQPQLGSFFEAINEFDAIELTPEMEPFLNSEMIRKYKNILLQWVGLPTI